MSPSVRSVGRSFQTSSQPFLRLPISIAGIVASRLVEQAGSQPESHPGPARPPHRIECAQVHWPGF